MGQDGWVNPEGPFQENYQVDNHNAHDNNAHSNHGKQIKHVTYDCPSAFRVTI